MYDAVVVNKGRKRVNLFAERNKLITTAHHGGGPIICHGNKLNKLQLGLVSEVDKCLEYVFIPVYVPSEATCKVASLLQSFSQTLS